MYLQSPSSILKLKRRRAINSGEKLKARLSINKNPRNHLEIPPKLNMEIKQKGMIPPVSILRNTIRKEVQNSLPKLKQRLRRAKKGKRRKKLISRSIC